MSHEAFTRLLETFGRVVGIDDVKPDDDGYCALSFDDLIVHFQYEDRQATIFSRIGEIDEDHAEGISAMLLAANIFWQGTKGATFGVEPDTQVVFIADRRPIDLISDDSFSSWIEDFVNIAEYWAGRLQTANDGGPTFQKARDVEQKQEPSDVEFMTRV